MSAMGIAADIFSITNNMLLCIVDYYSKFPIMKKADSLSADNLIGTAKIMFTEFKLPKKTVSKVGTNFISDQFKLHHITTRVMDRWKHT